MKTRKERIDGAETREAILSAATEEFAEKGYDLASARSICKRANVNIALANRYFGAKENLYRVVAQRLFGDLAKPMVDLAGKVNDEASWRSAIETWVDDFLYMTTSTGEPQRSCARLFRHEATHPSKWAAELKETFGKPVYDSLRELLALAGLKEEDLELWTASIWAQVAVYALADPWWLKSFRPTGVKMADWVGRVKDHILKGLFSALKYNGDSKHISN